MVLIDNLHILNSISNSNFKFKFQIQIFNINFNFKFQIWFLQTGLLELDLRAGEAVVKAEPPVAPQDPPPPDTGAALPVADPRDASAAVPEASSAFPQQAQATIYVDSLAESQHTDAAAVMDSSLTVTESAPVSVSAAAASIAEAAAAEGTIRAAAMVTPAAVAAAAAAGAAKTSTTAAVSVTPAVASAAAAAAAASVSLTSDIRSPKQGDPSEIKELSAPSVPALPSVLPHPDRSAITPMTGLSTPVGGLILPVPVSGSGGMMDLLLCGEDLPLQRTADPALPTAAIAEPRASPKVRLQR